MRAIVVGIALVVVACGAAQPPMDTGVNKRNEITVLWAQIRDWRREAKMPLDPAPQSVFQLKLRTVTEAKHVCPSAHKVPQTCNDVCGLADDICDNAETICKIADELGKDDDYAQDKCSSAKGSCREAKQKCCNCSSTPAAAPVLE